MLSLEGELESIAINLIKSSNSNLEINHVYFYAYSGIRGRFKCGVVFHYGATRKNYFLDYNIDFDLLYTDRYILNDFLQGVIKTISRKNVQFGLGFLNTTTNSSNKRACKKFIKEALRALSLEEREHVRIILE